MKKAILPLEKELETFLLRHDLSVIWIGSWMDNASMLLSCAKELLECDNRIKKILVIGAKCSVKNSWLSLVNTSPIFKELSIIPALGKVRQKKEALQSSKQIVVTNDEALEWIEIYTPDIAFLDINMRGMGGLALAEKITEIQRSSMNLNPGHPSRRETDLIFRLKCV